MLKLKRREITPVLVSNKDGKLKTDSLIVARVCERRHDNVMRDIKTIIASDVYKKRNQLNFELVQYKDAKGEMRPYYEMDRQGFEILAMGFTGEKALEWKFKYSDAFAAMEEALEKEAKQKATSNPFNLVDLGNNMGQVDVSIRVNQKDTRRRLMYVMARHLRCGRRWIQRLTNEIYQTLLDCPDATARNFREHMNLPAISAEYLTRDQFEGHIQICVSGIEQSMLILFSANQEITFGDIRSFALEQAKMYHKQLLRIAQQPPSTLVFDHVYNIVPILPYRERRMQL